MSLNTELWIERVSNGYSAGGRGDDLLFYILFNSISVISGQWLGDNERLCATEPCFWSEIFPLQVGVKLGTSKLAGQCITH